MKLAEALSLRSDLHKRLAQLTDRLKDCSRIQEGDQPADRPDELFEEFDRVATEFEALIHQINLTNLSIELDGGISMTAALAKRDVLRLRINAWRTAIAAAAGKQTRVTRSEVRFVAAIDVKSAHDQVDRLSRELRELDTRIQAANWTQDLKTL